VRQGYLTPAEATYTHDREDGPENPCAICRLHIQLAEAKAVLREVEWAGEDAHGNPACPLCDGLPTWESFGEGLTGRGHAPDCRLAKVLG
jgi:hypothetical protein